MRHLPDERVLRGALALSRDELAREWAARCRGAQLIDDLRRDGIDTLVLKGAAFAARLYDDTEWRTAVDVDLLVAPEQHGAAGAALRRAGFEPGLLATDTFRPADVHADEWVRPRDGQAVDLHRTIPGAGCPPERLWAALRPHFVPLDVGGVEVTSLDDPGLALVAALNAAHEGPSPRKGVGDLVRALERIPPAAWERAAQLARAVDADEAFAAGLGLAGAGALRDRLGLTAGPSANRRLAWDGAPGLANALRALRGAQSPAARCVMLARIVFPTPRALRAGSAQARRGRAGLVLAYARRPARLLRLTAIELRRSRAARRGPASRRPPAPPPAGSPPGRPGRS